MVVLCLFCLMAKNLIFNSMSALASMVSLYLKKQDHLQFLRGFSCTFLVSSERLRAIAEAEMKYPYRLFYCVRCAAEQSPCEEC